MKNRIIEILIAIPSILGCFLVASVSESYQLIGWISFLVADVFGIAFTVKNRYWFLFIQFSFFTVGALVALYKRLAWIWG